MLTCAHSYGIRLFTKGEAKVYNIIKIGSPLPAVSNTEDFMYGFVLSTDHALQDTVDLRVYRNDSKEDIVDIDECETVFGDASLVVDPPIFGDIRVLIEFSVDINGVLGMTLVEKDTGIRHALCARRDSLD